MAEAPQYQSGDAEPCFAEASDTEPPKKRLRVAHSKGVVFWDAEPGVFRNEAGDTHGATAAKAAATTQEEAVVVAAGRGAALIACPPASPTATMRQTGAAAGTSSFFPSCPARIAEGYHASLPPLPHSSSSTATLPADRGDALLSDEEGLASLNEPCMDEDPDGREAVEHEAVAGGVRYPEGMVVEVGMEEDAEQCLLDSAASRVAELERALQAAAARETALWASNRAMAAQNRAMTTHVVELKKTVATVAAAVGGA